MSSLKIKLSSKFLSIAGKRVAIRIDAGPWVPGVNPNLIKIRPRGSSSFPSEFRSALAIENNSDSREDYFEADQIRLLPGHFLYDAVRSFA